MNSTRLRRPHQSTTTTTPPASSADLQRRATPRRHRSMTHSATASYGIGLHTAESPAMAEALHSRWRSDESARGGQAFSPSRVPTIARLSDASAMDVLSIGDDGTGGLYLDQADAGAPGPAPAGGGAPAPADAGAPAAADAGAPAGAAVPVNLQQIDTGWVGGADKYGFQLKFRCGSSSGRAADLQAQAPKLTWREYVTYSRNDFSHRINPPSPTILPPGGVSFAPADTTVIGPNVLEFNDVTDTHWTPKSVVRAADFPPTGAHSFPAIMESSQLYQFSTDGASWTTFAGPFTLRRTFDQMAGPPALGAPSTSLDVFITEKVGIKMLNEPYKP
jgi:hypothetical protein